MATLSRILITNHGEIALRIVRTARDLGTTPIPPYTPEDLMSPVAELADEAYALSEGSFYTDAAALLELARITGADAIHPGYGFLSEDADFARSIIEAGVAWVGPSPEAMDALGDKMSARVTAERTQIAPVPGITGSVTDAETVIAFATARGYPITLKRTDGSGGRGITILHNDDEIRATPAFESTAQGGETLILERFVMTARHVETQCARDSRGDFAMVSTRDCSLQRRNQKLLEEAPVPFLPEGVRGRLVEASRRLLETVDYIGMATCEFLLTPEGDIWFLEVNPRLQVEHCVTKEVVGTDLVEIQLRIAKGGHLGQINEPRGHSLELRITCEDLVRGLASSTGTITRLRWPAGPGIRIESGVTEGDVVTPLFDPMLVKIIITGASREQAITRTRRALRETVVEGVIVCTALHSEVLTRPEFTALDETGRLAITTRWIENEVLPDLADAVAASQANDSTETVANPCIRSSYIIELNGRHMQLTLPDGILAPSNPARGFSPRSNRAQPLHGRSGTPRSSRDAAPGETGAADGEPGVIAVPMQAIVTRICVEPGQPVYRGDLLVVLESMKMEDYVHAPNDGTILEIPASAGRTVSAGDVLVHMNTPENDSEEA